jgi:pyruvate/2-oxoglutarate dehydrogenase complex dihydrolipoamide acyltransferase (E2) component
MKEENQRSSALIRGTIRRPSGYHQERQSEVIRASREGHQEYIRIGSIWGGYLVDAAEPTAVAAWAAAAAAEATAAAAAAEAAAAEAAAEAAWEAAARVAAVAAEAASVAVVGKGRARRVDAARAAARMAKAAAAARAGAAAAAAAGRAAAAGEDHSRRNRCPGGKHLRPLPCRHPDTPHCSFRRRN